MAERNEIFEHAEITCEYVVAEDKITMIHETSTGSTKVVLKTTIKSFEGKPHISGDIIIKTAEVVMQAVLNDDFANIKPSEVVYLTPEKRDALLKKIDFFCAQGNELKVIVNKKIQETIKALQRVVLDAIPNLLERFKLLNL